MKLKRFLITFAILFALMLVVPMVALAQGEVTPTFGEWLLLISGPGLGAAVAALVSLLAENWAGYQDLSSRLKSIIFMSTCLVIGVGSAALRALMGFVPWSWDPLIWTALWNALAQYGVSRFGRDMFWKASLKE